MQPFQAKPEWLGEMDVRIKEFIEFHRKLGRCVAIVTSGGTAVPLEHNTVRFIDNFSTGSRGAASTEYFLKLDYAVIHLYRPGSIMPFARQLQKSISPYLDSTLMDTLALDTSKRQIQMDITCVPEAEQLAGAVEMYQQVREQNKLLSLPFTSVSDYLTLLQHTATLVEPLGERALFYLAAAVSDFYIPLEQLPRHKIQSRAGELQLELTQVPKMLGTLRHELAPRAFFVSFKLETDWTMLRKKSRQSIENYGMHVVVANELHSRFKQVVLIRAEDEHVIRKSQDHLDIEEPLVHAICQTHYQHLAASSPEITSTSVVPFAKPRHPLWYQMTALWDEHQQEIVGMIVGSALSVMFNFIREKYLR